jgi:hypothetical protein
MKLAYISPRRRISGVALPAAFADVASRRIACRFDWAFSKRSTSFPA